MVTRFGNSPTSAGPRPVKWKTAHYKTCTPGLILVGLPPTTSPLSYVCYVNPIQAPIVLEIPSFPQEPLPSLLYTNSIMYSQVNSQGELTNDLTQQQWRPNLSLQSLTLNSRLRNPRIQSKILAERDITHPKIMNRESKNQETSFL